MMLQSTEPYWPGPIICLDDSDIFRDPVKVTETFLVLSGKRGKHVGEMWLIISLHLLKERGRMLIQQAQGEVCMEVL